ncbi:MULTISPECIES: hypothetical protein [Streptococcus]|jgi:hypothetical protein|uniref:Uncharacterized protein n=1 Tax=Streptococcus mitis TaxID=28037 RepID=A0A3R9ME82_STRMT|nr:MULTISPECIES: hypothetical protein [Streptococcus]OFO02871.1 hypothetical protein HMPREF2613_07455 [Streptococcus sp. HMSC070B10]RSJ97530.1 hypothetical protein D8786_05470 [Streptococcus mitis]
MTEEKVIKRSPKKIIWNALFGFFSVLFFLLPLYYLHSYSQKGTRLHTISLLLMLVLLTYAGVGVYLTYRLLSSDKEYLRFTVKGFYYKPNPKKASHFYAWADVEEFSFSRIRGKYRDSYRIEVYFKNKDNVKSQSLLALLKRRCFTFHQSVDLIIPIFLLDVVLPERVYEVMKYYEREWRIEQNRQAGKQTKQASKTKSSERL